MRARQETALEPVSKMLAGVSSKDIMAVVEPLQTNYDHTDANTRGIMMMYEIAAAHQSFPRPTSTIQKIELIERMAQDSIVEFPPQLLAEM